MLARKANREDTDQTAFSEKKIVILIDDLIHQKITEKKIRHLAEILNNPIHILTKSNFQR